MRNPLFSRFDNITTPIMPLSKNQEQALNSFRERLDQQYYHFEHASCLCGSREATLFARRDRYALQVSTYICKSCGLMWTSPRMTEESLTAFYDRDYRPIYVGCDQAPEEFFHSQTESGRLIYRFVEAHIHTPGPRMVFDVGCGAGGVLVPFVEKGWRASGCDLGTQYLGRGRAVGLQLEQGDVTALTKHGRADLIILRHVLEHLRDPQGSLEHITRLTTDNACVYVELPGIFFVHKTYGDFLRFLQNAHLYHFTLRTLTSLMAKAGFSLVEGNEEIRALFRKTATMPEVNTADQYGKIMVYFYFTEIGRMLRFWQYMHAVRHRTVGVRRLLFGGILGRVSARFR